MDEYRMSLVMEQVAGNEKWNINEIWCLTIRKWAIRFDWHTISLHFWNRAGLLSTLCTVHGLVFIDWWLTDVLLINHTQYCIILSGLFVTFLSLVSRISIYDTCIIGSCLIPQHTQHIVNISPLFHFYNNRIIPVVWVSTVFVEWLSLQKTGLYGVGL